VSLAGPAAQSRTGNGVDTPRRNVTSTALTPERLIRAAVLGGSLVRVMSSESLHEPAEQLSDETKNLHRALVSLREELEAVDWYQQRAEACTDDDLKAVLTHNKNEEIEHAMMTLEWLRRRHPVFASNIGTYIGSSGAITEVEKQSVAGGTAGAAPGGVSSSLGIGSLKGAT
jgi:ferritin-like protein